MIRTYLKLGFRNLLRNRRHTLLNITGLAISMAVCLIIFLVVNHETGYNKYLQNYDRLYHIITKEKSENKETFTSGVNFPTIKYLKQDYPNYRFGEMMQFRGTQVSVQPSAIRPSLQKFYEEAPVCYMDSTMAALLEIKLIAGDAGLFRNQDKLAISRSTAEKYFGNYQSAVGKTLNINTQTPDIEIGAVFEDIPVKSDFPMFMIGSFEYFKKINPDGWNLENWSNLSSNHQLYASIPSDNRLEGFTTYLKGFIKKYSPQNKNEENELMIRPFSAIHYDERVDEKGDHITSWNSIYTLIIVGILILMMACINFINLSTALAFSRSKEMGVRKVLGSNKWQIRGQLFAETTLLVTVSMILAIALALLSVPFVKHLMVVQSDLSFFTPYSILFIVILTILTIFLAGSYPAFVLSNFSPIAAIKNTWTAPGRSSILTRKGLVVLQFACSQILFIATLITILQMQFIKKTDLGFDKEAVLNLFIANDSINTPKLKPFKQALLSRSDVQTVGLGFDPPSSQNSWTTNFAFDIMDDKPYEVAVKFGEPDYFETFGLQFAAGGSYPPTDTINSYVINEAFVKKVGLQSPDDAIGKMLRVGGGAPKPVIGVVKDFNQASLRDVVRPIVFMPFSRYYSIAAIKLNTQNIKKTREGVEKVWDAYFPEIVFQSKFYDEEIEQYYQQDIRLSRMYWFCALLAMLISCLGLFGLVSFTIAQKTKEVGVRKVLGATVGQIVYLFSKDFFLLVCVAFCIAAPVSYYFIQQWLQGFAYRISISPLVFLSAILVSVVTAFLAVGFKSFQAARANPVKSLRME